MLKPSIAAPIWRKLGWMTLLAFSIKGVATTFLIVWALLTSLP